MKIFYVETCGSYVICNNENEVFDVVNELYVINKHDDLKIREVDIIREGIYVGKDVYGDGYSFGEIVELLKEYDKNISTCDSFEVRKIRGEYMVWKSFQQILSELNIGEACNVDEPYELFGDCY